MPTLDFTSDTHSANGNNFGEPVRVGLESVHVKPDGFVNSPLTNEIDDVLSMIQALALAAKDGNHAARNILLDTQWQILTTSLVVWQSSIDMLLQIDSPSRNGLWFEEKEISHGQISCHPHG